MQSQGINVVLSPPSPKKTHSKVGVVLGVIVGALILVAAVLYLFALFRKLRSHQRPSKSSALEAEAVNSSAVSEAEFVEITTGATKEKKVDTSLSEAPKAVVAKSGNLIFFSGEGTYDLEKLMRASAELLGRATMGTTYKAVMSDEVVVTAKSLDASKTAIASGEVFERQMEVVGQLKHTNLVPARAEYQAKEEMLVIYDYQPNGSLFNLIHGLN